MKLTAYGRREWLGAALIAASLISIDVCLLVFGIVAVPPAVVIAVFIGAVWLCLAGFFRDPERRIIKSEAYLLSPADGVVRDIELIKSETECEELRDLFNGRDMLRIGIFLSVFNVHLNRAPAGMRIVFKKYKQGAFHDARDGRASKENESMLIGGIATIDGIEYPVAVRQISGAIARRIVCPVEPGENYEQGQRYGMIKFGSRTELYFPAGVGFEPAVPLGKSVAGGVTVMVKISPDSKEKLKNALQQ